jgi:hypothetical protein
MVATLTPDMVAVPSTGPPLPPFVAYVERVTAGQLRDSWHPGCPVAPSQLRGVRLRFVGFDGQAHVGRLVVNAAVTSDAIAVFRDLYRARFPIRRMRPVDAYRGNDARSMAADNTSAFNCRYAVTSGARQWSMHAYGEAIDVDTVENPYLLAGQVRPANAKAYANRRHVRPGMAVAGGVLVRAFARVGWGWGGRWASSPDYQHFSTNGR